MAIAYSKQVVELREVVLKQKPHAMLECSPKGTVPVLILPDDKVIDESWEVMLWALSRHDPQQWMPPLHSASHRQLDELIAENDNVFKGHLDRYKYADRYPAHSVEYYRTQGELFLQTLESHLETSRYLLGDQITVADIAIMPFIRQFAFVDHPWFLRTPYRQLQRWLDYFLQSTLFNSVMEKYTPWHEGEKSVLFPSMASRDA